MDDHEHEPFGDLDHSASGDASVEGLEDDPRSKYPDPGIPNAEEQLTPDVSEVVEPEVLTPRVRLGRNGQPPPSRKGKPGAGGRPKGSPNRITLEVKQLSRNLLSDPVYIRKLKLDLRKRKLHPQMESVLWAYAYGKPVERVELGRVGDFSKLSDAELMAQFEATVKALRGEGTRSLRSA